MAVEAGERDMPEPGPGLDCLEQRCGDAERVEAIRRSREFLSLGFGGAAIRPLKRVRFKPLSPDRCLTLVSLLTSASPREPSSSQLRVGLLPRVANHRVSV